ncbi:MAG: PqiC family protein [Rhizomicrobium sp.]
MSLLVALLALAACSSATTHYYTLQAPSAIAAPSGQPVPFLIDVLPVSIPASLDQPQIVVRQSDSTLALLDTERWASSLDDEIRGALSAELTKQLGTQDTAGLFRPASQPLMRIKVQIRQFDAWPGQRVQLNAGWSIIPAEDADKSPLTCFGQFDADAPGEYQDMVLAQRRVVIMLADHIAADARNRGHSPMADCSR